MPPWTRAKAQYIFGPASPQVSFDIDGIKISNQFVCYYLINPIKSGMKKRSYEKKEKRKYFFMEKRKPFFYNQKKKRTNKCFFKEEQKFIIYRYFFFFWEKKEKVFTLKLNTY